MIDKETLYNMKPSKARDQMIVQLYLQGKSDEAQNNVKRDEADKQFKKASQQQKGTRFFLNKYERENILNRLDDIWLLQKQQEKHFQRHCKQY